jgi:hypothetical protein
MKNDALLSSAFALVKSESEKDIVSVIQLFRLKT